MIFIERLQSTKTDWTVLLTDDFDSKAWKLFTLEVIAADEKGKILRDLTLN